MISVFDRLWIEIDGKTGHYAKLCSIHGRERAALRPIRQSQATGDHAILAELVTTACAARDAREFWEALRTLADEWPDHPDPIRRDYEQPARWLRRTLGFAREEIERALGRIAECEKPPPGYEADYWGRPLKSYYAVQLGSAAAELFCFPALLALTDTCAEYEVLAQAFVKQSAEMEERLSREHRKTGLSAWKVAAACVRAFMEVLRRRHLYAL